MRCRGIAERLSYLELHDIKRNIFIVSLLLEPVRWFIQVVQGHYFNNHFSGRGKYEDNCGR